MASADADCNGAPTARCPLCLEGLSELLVRYALPRLTVATCRRCRLSLVDQPSDEATLRTFYDASYFLSRRAYFFPTASKWASTSSWWSNRTEFVAGLEALEKLGGGRGRLLDVGCGVGNFVLLAQERGFEASGIDVSEFAVRSAREKRGLDVTQTTLGQLDVEDEKYDVVTMWDLIGHVADPLREIEHARRVLRPGGCLLINTPNEAALLRRIARVCHRVTYGAVSYPMSKLYHRDIVFYFTKRALVRLVEYFAFSVLRLEGTTIPLVKARGAFLEKSVVGAIQLAERLLGSPYQLRLIARAPT